MTIELDLITFSWGDVHRSTMGVLKHDRTKPKGGCAFAMFVYQKEST